MHRAAVKRDTRRDLPQDPAAAGAAGCCALPGTPRAGAALPVPGNPLQSALSTIEARSPLN